jgi:hypothetical protein
MKTYTGVGIAASINFFCELFNDALSISRLYIVEWHENRRMMNWKRFGRKRLWQSRCGIPVFAWSHWEIHEKLQSAKTVSRLRFEPSTSWIQIYSDASRTIGSVAPNNLNLVTVCNLLFSYRLRRLYPRGKDLRYWIRGWMAPILGLDAAKANIRACSRNRTSDIEFSHYTA